MTLNILGTISVNLAVILVSFSFYNPKSNDKKENNNRTDSYFKYVGIPGMEEDDNTKWEEITQAQYDDPIIIPCSGPKKGCKIKVNCTVTINGVRKPCCVTVILIGGKKSPIVATICGTAEIKNKDNS